MRDLWGWKRDELIAGIDWRGATKVGQDDRAVARHGSCPHKTWFFGFTHYRLFPLDRGCQHAPTRSSRRSLQGVANTITAFAHLGFAEQDS